MNTNTYTPSKELLSVVFNTTVKNIELDRGQTEVKIYRENTSCLGVFNIYELAIKTKQKYPDIDLNLAATDISEFWRQANELVRGANNE